jgi:hypothetical protein
MKAAIAIMFGFVTLVNAHADVDLDEGFPLARLAPEMVLSSVDVAPGFPPIVNQNPLGACQSYAMTAWLEYLFFYKTGHVINLSEKYTAYHLLNFMIDEFWSEKDQTYPTEYLDSSALTARPQLGSGIAPFMIEAYLRASIVPDSVYSFGNMVAKDGAISMDMTAFNTYFESETIYSRLDYLSALEEAFLSPPPKRFVYKLRQTDFSAGTEETIEIKSPEELSALIALDRQNVVTYYNKEYTSHINPLPPEATEEFVDYFMTISGHFNHRSIVADRETIKTAILGSLDKKMAVMFAGDVWVGDWSKGVIFQEGGGHAMVIVGYQKRDEKLYFKLRNSWGKEHGVKGYNYIEANALMADTIYIVTHEI